MRITDSKVSRQIKLHDGRMLGYAEYGDPGGTPVFYFHGFPTSRLDWPDDVADLADELELDRFVVLGGSGGGPFAAACAFRIPARLTAGEAAYAERTEDRRLSSWLTGSSWVGVRDDCTQTLGG